ncbi:MAG: hypothetical protein MUO23_03160 [Anaerolineales bacterium]|nr:hypothetical protein [Anaerolineales bacterium]
MKPLNHAHVVAFALLPAVSLLGHNIDMAPPSHALRPALLSLLLMGISLALFNRLFRDLAKASALTSMLLILFFSYGHVYSGLVTEGTFRLFARAGLVGRHEILAPTWLALFLLAAWAISRMRQRVTTLSSALNVMAVAALAVPLMQIVLYEYQISQPWQEPPQTASANAPGDWPDIYYIVVDGYAGEDVLRSIYQYDNGPFLDKIADLGFLVAGQSRSNYMQTSLSLASSLNLEYIDTLQPALPSSGDDRAPLARLIRWSAVRRFLEDHGYRIVGLPSGYRVTELENADLYLRAPVGASTTLERLAIETSGLVLLKDLAAALGVRLSPPGYQAHRDRLLFTLDQLRQSPSIPGPKFVFAHIILPHPPFVFDADGAPVLQDRPFTLMDGDAFLGTPDDYLSGYRAQVSYLNSVLPDILRSLIEKSPRPPIIVLQADHGPGSRLDWHSAGQTDLTERTSILNAYYLAGEGSPLFYETITPVNSFRLVFDKVFHANYPFLEDRSYFSTWEQPYHFIAVP